MVAVAGVILALSVAPGTPGIDVPGGDELGHLAEFAVLGALTTRASNARSRALVAVSLACALGLVTEAAQLAAPGRTAELGDLAADLLGGLLGAAGWSLAGRGHTWAGRSSFS